MIAYCPGKIPHGMTNHQVVLYDFLSTACELAGVEPPENDGISFVPLLEGDIDNQEEHAYLYWGGGTFTPRAQAVRMGDWFAMRESMSEPIQLWNLVNDLECEHNVAVENPEIVKEVVKIMQNEHEDSEWYPNPGDSEEDIRLRKERAQQSGQMQEPIKANSIYPELN